MTAVEGDKSLKTISRKAIGVRYVLSAVVLACGCLVAWVSDSSWDLWVILAAIPVVMAWNSYQVARRKVFTAAAENMQPLSRVDDDTLFPEEIDPYLARPTYIDITNCVMNHFLVSGPVFFVTLSLVAIIAEKLEVL